MEKCDVLKLIAEVKKRPYLYDCTSPDHPDRIKTAVAWKEISNLLNYSARDCKEKWRKIRIAFGRFLKLSKSNTPQSRAYYLSKHLQFLKPYLKTINGPALTGDQTTNTRDIKVKYINERLEGVKNEYMSNEEEILISEYNNEQDQGDVINDDEGQLKEDVAPIRSQKRDYNTTEDDKDKMSPRKMFLLSLLPDVESLSEQEMRIFRKRTIIAIDDIINARNTIQNPKY